MTRAAIGSMSSSQPWRLCGSLLGLNHSLPQASTVSQMSGRKPACRHWRIIANSRFQLLLPSKCAFTWMQQSRQPLSVQADFSGVTFAAVAVISMKSHHANLSSTMCADR